MLIDVTLTILCCMLWFISSYIYIITLVFSYYAIIHVQLRIMQHVKILGIIDDKYSLNHCGFSRLQAQKLVFHDRYKEKNLTQRELWKISCHLSSKVQTVWKVSKSKTLFISPPDNTHFPLFMIPSLSLIIYGALIVRAGWWERADYLEMLDSLDTGEG